MTWISGRDGEFRDKGAILGGLGAVFSGLFGVEWRDVLICVNLEKTFFGIFVVDLLLFFKTGLGITEKKGIVRDGKSGKRDIPTRCRGVRPGSLHARHEGEADGRISPGCQS